MKEYNNILISDIKNLDKKLRGELPVDRNELKALVDTWGRKNSNLDESKLLKLDLSKLDVSKVRDMEELFKDSLFNGIISEWKTQSVENMKNMFCNSDFNGNISDWYTGYVINFDYMFKDSKFNGEIGKWNTNIASSMEGMFYNAKDFNRDLGEWLLHLETFNKEYSKKILSNMFEGAIAFKNKYNNGENIPNNSNSLKEWFQEKINNPESRIEKLGKIFIESKNLFVKTIEENKIDKNSDIFKSLQEKYYDSQKELKYEIDFVKYISLNHINQEYFINYMNLKNTIGHSNIDSFKELLGKLDLETQEKRMKVNNIDISSFNVDIDIFNESEKSNVENDKEIENSFAIER